MKIIKAFVLLMAASNAGAEINLDTAAANKYAIYAMMASNSYLKPDRTYFPIEELGWIRVDADGNPAPANSYTPGFIGSIFTNLQYDIWENKSKKTTVISFKGTDERIDWLAGNLTIIFSPTYKSAKKHVHNYVAEHPDQKIILTGHSLGGGLALSSSLWEAVDAYVFNSSPRVFDGFKNHNNHAERISVYQHGDVLQKIRAKYPKYQDVISEKNIVLTKFDYPVGKSAHRADMLAEGLLRCASDPDLVKLASTLPVKVQCKL